MNQSPIRPDTYPPFTAPETHPTGTPPLSPVSPQRPASPTSARWLSGLLFDALLARPTPALEAVAPDLYLTAIHGGKLDAVGWRDLPLHVTLPLTFRPVYRRANRAATTFRFIDGSALKLRPGTIDWATWYVPAGQDGTPMLPLLPASVYRYDEPAIRAGIDADTLGRSIAARIEHMLAAYEAMPTGESTHAGQPNLRVLRQGGKLIAMGWHGGAHQKSPLPCGVMFGKFLCAALDRLIAERQAAHRAAKYQARRTGSAVAPKVQP